VAANQSLTLTGGTTANRPASPTEGMLFYDTTTDRLLVYSNGKWQADRSTATVIVAAENSTQTAKDSADFVVPTSATDAQVTINNAIAALPASGGIVYLLEGTYVVNGSVSVTSNVTLSGSGRSTIVQLTNSHNVNINIINVANPSNNVKITNLYIDGNRANQTSGTAMRGISSTNAGSGSGSSAVPGVMIDSVYVVNARNDGIYLNSATNSSITNSTATNNGSSGIWASSLINSQITNSKTQGNTGSGLELYGSASVDNVVANNVSDSNGSRGIRVWGGVGQTTINDNAVTNNSGSGINISNGSDGNTISNNIVDGNSTGIDVSTSDTNVIEGNIVTNNTSWGLYVVGSDYTQIVNNTVRSNGLSGIYFPNVVSSFNNISNNLIAQNSTEGVYIYDSPNNTISNNKIHDNTGTGSSSSIYLRGNADNTRVMGNVITDTAGTGHAILISSSTNDTSYLSNNYFSGTGASSISDAGTGTIYANQALGPNGTNVVNRNANSTTAFQIQNAAGTALLSADTTNARIGIGTGAPEFTIHSVSNGNSFLASDSYGGGNVFLGRRANGTQASPTTLQGGDLITQFGARGYDGTSFSGTRGAITINAQGTWSGTSQGTSMSFFTTPIGSTTMLEVMRISNNGNIGIGTSAPRAQLEIGSRTPEIVSQLELPGDIGPVFDIVGDYLYAGSRGSTSADNFYIIDISDPLNPEVVSTLAYPNGAQQSTVKVRGSYAYVRTTFDPRFYVIDVSNPTNPFIIREYSDLVGNTARFEIAGRYMYTFNNSSTPEPRGVRIIDIADPRNFKIVGEVDLDVTVQSVALSRGYLYLSTTINGMSIVDVRDPTKPVITSFDEVSGLGNGYDIQVRDRTAYIVSNAGATGSIHSIDVSDPYAPVKIDEITVNDTGARLEIAGRYAYVGLRDTYTVNSLAIVDISDPSNMQLLSSQSIQDETATGLKVNGRYLYVATDSASPNKHLHVLDIGGIDANAAYIGTTRTTTLTVDRDATIDKNLQVGGGINTGAGIQAAGTLSVQGNGYIAGPLSVGVASAQAKLHIRDKGGVYVVQSATGCCAAGNQSATFNITPQEGNLLVAVTAHRSSGTTASIVEAGWTKVAEDHFETTTSNRRGLAVFYKIAGAAESSTVTSSWSGTVSNNNIVIREYATPSGSFQFDVATDNNSGATLVSSLTTGTTASISNVNSLIVTAVAMRDDTPNASWTNGVTNNLNNNNTTTLQTAWVQSNSLGTKESTASWTGTRHATAAIAVFSIVDFEAQPVLLVDKDDSTPYLTVSNTGNVGIGNASSSHIKLSVSNTTTNTGVFNALYQGYFTVNPASNSAGNYVSNYSATDLQGSNDISDAKGVVGEVYNYNTGNATELIGTSGYVGNFSGGNITTQTGLNGIVEINSNGGNVGSLQSLNLRNFVGGGTVTNQYGINISALENNGGTLTNRYGMYIATPVGAATNDYGIYQAGSGQINYFAGTVRVGTFGGSTATTVCRAGDGTLSACSSNEHLKQNITDLNVGGLDTIRQLQARQFNWSSDGRADLGFIAEEVEAINPLLAQYESDGRLSGVKYMQLTALLTQGVQQLDSQAQSRDLRITQAEATLGDIVVASGSYLQNGMSANFSSLNVSGPTTLSSLTVTGNATIQGNLSVQGSLTVQNATIAQNITVNGRILSSTSIAPQITIHAELFTEDMLQANIEGTDSAGEITLTASDEFEYTESEENKGITLTTIVFANEVIGSVPHVSITPIGPESTGLDVYIQKTDNGFILGTLTAPKPGHTYRFDYIVISSMPPSY
jgi:parallel beta-helix repeat protein